jgi:hypothetical protein
VHSSPALLRALRKTRKHANDEDIFWSVKGGLTTHSTRLAIRLPFILQVYCSPVNSGVSRLVVVPDKVC